MADENPKPESADEAALSPPANRVQVGVGERGLAFTNLDEMIRFANGLITGGVAPPGMKAGGVVAVLQAGAELGMKPMWSLAHLNFINGRLGIDGMASLALVRSSGICRPDGQPTFSVAGEPYTDEWTVTCAAHRRDRDKPTAATFSFADAQRMGLLKHDPEKRQVLGRGKGGGWSDLVPWATATLDMMQWRAWGRLSKREFGDVILGLPLIDELREIQKAQPIRDVVPVPAAGRKPAQDEPDPLLEVEAIDPEVLPAEPTDAR
jgi:hypothetical protein